MPVAQLDRVSDSDAEGLGRRKSEYVPVAQLDRALDSDSKGQRFESSRVRQKPPKTGSFRGFRLLWGIVGIMALPHLPHFLSLKNDMGKRI